MLRRASEDIMVKFTENIENSNTRANSSSNSANTKKSDVQEDVNCTNDGRPLRVGKESKWSIDDLCNMSLDELWQACDANPTQLMNLISEFIGRRAGHVERSFGEFEAHSCASNSEQSASKKLSDSQSDHRADSVLNSEECDLSSPLNKYCVLSNRSKCDQLSSSDADLSDQLISESTFSKHLEHVQPLEHSKLKKKSELKEHLKRTELNENAQTIKVNKKTEKETNIGSTNLKSNLIDDSDLIEEDIENNRNEKICRAHDINLIRSACTQNDNCINKNAKCDRKTIENVQQNQLNTELVARSNPSKKTEIRFTVDQLSREDCYNGSAIYDLNTNELAYSWSQNLRELEITIPVSENVKNKNQCEITIRTNDLKVVLRSDLKAFELSGRLAHSIRPDTVYWTVESGRCLRLFMEKAQTRWWDRFLECESKLDLDKLEKIIPYEQLSIEEQNFVQQLAFQQMDKLKLQSIDQ